VIFQHIKMLAFVITNAIKCFIMPGVGVLLPLVLFLSFVFRQKKIAESSINWRGLIFYTLHAIGCKR
jgi:hypothetical protein